MHRRILAVEPSSIFSELNIGAVIDVEGTLYCLVQRDPWRAYVVRYYWFDPFLARLHEWRKRRHEDKD